MKETFQVDIWYREDGISKRLPFIGTHHEIARQMYILYEMGSTYIHFKTQPGLDCDKLSVIIKQHINQES